MLKTTTPSFLDYRQKLGQPLNEDIINCEFRIISSFLYENKYEISNTGRKIYYETIEDGNPRLITFTGLSTEQPKMKGNLDDGPLIMIKNDEESVILVEQNVFGEMFIYTIFKQEKVAIWYKAYKLMNDPYGMISMGYCY